MFCNYERPDFCYSCGHPYPWIAATINNAIELISLDVELDENSKQILKNSIPDLIVDTANTPLAAGKYKILIENASQTVRNALYNLIIDIASETAKKILTD